MTLELWETLVRRLGGLLAYTTLVIVLYGLWRGTHRQVGLATGRNPAWLRSPWFYLASTLLYIGICYLGWIPLPLRVSGPSRAWMLAFGALLYFPGMSFILWGRLTLGKNYFVSTGIGTQLFADHRLVTSGPFAIVRHPMYSGLILAAFGSLVVYFTWTTLLFACFAPLIIVRALNEEQALSAEFGEQWLEYCRRVPAFILFFKR